ncbi:MAG: hypothetical protein MI919_22095, partial [Holophagales bacterium]|nr:hypothetical protein [Holophagales bacterium]
MITRSEEEGPENAAKLAEAMLRPFGRWQLRPCLQHGSKRLGICPVSNDTEAECGGEEERVSAAESFRPLE